MPALTEDEIYRNSSQFRLWSFSPEQLADQRRKTHTRALERARRYGAADADCLSEEQELRLVQRYCELIRTTSDHLTWPSHVKATAVQYLRRFYLSNSCMTYPPKEIYKTALYLASKSEATHVKVTDYASRISAGADAILAPEYKVMQALRFTLDVKQPFRGLKGVLMELTNMAEGMLGRVEGAEVDSLHDVQRSLRELSFPTPGSKTPWQAPSTRGAVTVKQFTDRILAAYSAARDIIDAPASLTDAYFLYTPSQILLGAMHLADPPLTSFYLDTKLPLSSATRPKILATIHACAELMAAYSPQNAMTKDERAQLEKKLERCRDPSTQDLIKLHAAMKRGDVDDDNDEGKEAKKRKLERQKSSKELDDVFGPSLGQPKG